MSSPVIIFSTDRLRTGITQKVLKRAGIESLSVNRISEAGNAVVDNAPCVVIFDTKGIFPDELNMLKNLCHTLRDTAVLVLGDRSIIDTFVGDGIQKMFYLPDPLDPELIVSKVKDALCSKTKEQRLQKNGLESDLKQFLKLD